MKTKTKFALIAVFLLTLFGGCFGGGGGSGGGNKNNHNAIVGEDKDGDLMRDDIALSIRGFTNDAKEQETMIKTARAFGAAIIAGGQKDEKAAEIARAQMANALNCMRETFADRQSYDEASLFVELETTNTDERLFAYWRYNELLSGKTYNDSDRCER
ncbi:MAG: hypothetical protein LBU73_08550 [Helicobacteraceae bacterium]|jgi:hypothetical protein|nr:hypothetical protein [Helicobacteraceae bacterium]